MGVTGLTIVDTFSDPFMLHLVRYRLECEGIETFTENEHGMSLYAIYPRVGWGRVPVSVPSDQAVRAREIIQEIHGEVCDGQDEFHLTCPRCESDNTYTIPDESNALGGISKFFARLKRMLSGPTVKCNNCGHRW